MAAIDQYVPEELRGDFASRAIDPPQSEVVTRAIAALRSGSNTIVSLPRDLAPVLIIPGVIVEFAAQETDARPKVLVIVPSEAAVDQYTRGFSWLKPAIAFDRIDRDALRSSTSLRQQLGESNVLVSTAEQLLAGLKRNLSLFAQLDAFGLIAIDEHIDTTRLDKFRDELKPLVSTLVERKRVLLYLVEEASAGAGLMLATASASTTTIIVGRRWWRRAPKLAPNAGRRRPPPPLPKRTFSSPPDRARSGVRAPHISIGYLERLFWLGLVLCLIVLDFQLLPLDIVMIRVSYLASAILPVVLRTILVVAGIKLALFVLFAWRPDIALPLLQLGKRALAWVLRISPEQLDLQDDGDDANDEADDADDDLVIDNPPRRRRGLSADAYVPPPSQHEGDLVPLPIAERATRRSLFRSAERPPGKTRNPAFVAPAEPEDLEDGALAALESALANATTTSSLVFGAEPSLGGPAADMSADEQDELLHEAIKLVRQHKRVSASLLQRRLRIGYSKAAQLIDLLEQQRIVGPADDGRSRVVLINDT